MRGGRALSARAGSAALAVALGLTALTACSGGGSDGTKSTSVFDVKVGECFTTPSKVKAELSDVNRVPCTKDHTQEAYAVVDYTPSASAVASGAPTSTTDYPGSDVLTSFAKGMCAQRFIGYVGVDYLDSTLFFTYLLPSARGWEQQDDHAVLCFVTTTGKELTESVKGSKI